MRHTWHWSPAQGKLVEGPSPRRTDGSGDGWKYSDRLYSAAPFRAHDGTLIDSKRKHREYMRRHGLSTADDFKGTWDRAAKQREQAYTGRHDRRARLEAVRRAVARRG
jgi:hypothetical protein